MNSVLLKRHYVAGSASQTALQNLKLQDMMSISTCLQILRIDGYSTCYGFKIKLFCIWLIVLLLCLMAILRHSRSCA